MAATTNSEEDNLVVKKDQLLVTHSLKVTGLNPEEVKKPVEGSLTQSTASKLNPGAGLAENSKPEKKKPKAVMTPKVPVEQDHGYN